jgi:hypothetical protein
MKNTYVFLIALLIVVITNNSLPQPGSTPTKPNPTVTTTSKDSLNLDSISRKKDSINVLKRLYYLGVIDMNNTENLVGNGGKIESELSSWFNNKIKQISLKKNETDKGIVIKDDDLTLIEKIGARNYYNFLMDKVSDSENQKSSGKEGGTTSTEEIKKEMLRILQLVAPNITFFGDDEVITERWLILDQDTVRKVTNILDREGRLRIEGSNQIKEYRNLVKDLNIAIVISASKNLRDPSALTIDSLSFYTILDLSLPPEFRSSVFDAVKYSEFKAVMQSAKVSYEHFEEKTNWTTSIYKSYFFISALKPEFLFYDSRRINIENLNDESEGYSYNGHLVSLFGQWGFDPIPLYGWYSDELVGGLKYSLTTTRNLYKPYLTVSLGIINKFDRPFKRANPEGNLYNSGYGIFVRTETPLPFISDVWTPLSYFQLEFEGKFTFNSLKKTKYEEGPKFDFYTYRNYLNWELRMFLPQLKNIDLFPNINIGNLEFALGLTQVDLRHYTYDPLDLSSTEVVEKLPKKSGSFFSAMNNGFIAKIALVKYHGYTTYKLEGFYSQNKWNSYIGGEIEMLFNDFLGFTAKIAVNSKKAADIEPWQKDLYVVFSPIIKFSF